MKSTKWVVFHFESNQVFGEIENLEQQLIAAQWKIQSLEAGGQIDPPKADGVSKQYTNLEVSDER
jgi:hypothetical protein